jgi:hypothetical protein
VGKDQCNGKGGSLRLRLRSGLRQQGARLAARVFSGRLKPTSPG